MKPLRKKRLVLICLMVVALAGAVGSILFALKQNINVFYTPSEMIADAVPTGQMVRLGGMVAEGSVQREDHNLFVKFIVTDLTHQLSVNYNGVLPNLFREGKGVVVQGKLAPDGQFVASQVLAKHDENYMPPKIAKAIAP